MNLGDEGNRECRHVKRNLNNKMETTMIYLEPNNPKIRTKN